MRPVNKYIIGIFLISFFYNTVSAINNEEEPQKQYQRYEEIKKEHNKDFQKGVYNDEKKDYVKKWIDDDINYQKRIIKLKSDYRAWAMERQSAGREVIFKEYEPLKSLTAAERETLQEYHNNLFKINEKENANKSAAVKNAGKIKPKNKEQKAVAVQKKKSSEKKQDDALKKKEISAEIAVCQESTGKDEVGNSIYFYMIIGFASLLIIAECIYLFIKRIK
jgi:hypothetical protein